VQDFIIKEKIGSGSYGIVFKVVRKVDRVTYAMKEIDLAGMSRKEQEECIRETRVLSQLDSDYIIKYYDSFLERVCLCNKVWEEARVLLGSSRAFVDTHLLPAGQAVYHHGVCFQWELARLHQEVHVAVGGGAGLETLSAGKQSPNQHHGSGLSRLNRVLQHVPASSMPASMVLCADPDGLEPYALQEDSTS
jgi:hypothetical protein